MKKYLFIFLVLFLPFSVRASEKNTVNIYFFHSNTCSHCKAEEKFLKKLEKNYDYVKVYRYEVHAQESQEYISLLEEEYQISLTSVPVTVVGNEMIFGYQEERTDREIMRDISYFSSYYYQDKLGERFKIKTLPTYRFKKSNPTIEEYFLKIDDKILGFIPTKNLDYYTLASILGFLGGINLYYLFSLLILFLIVRKCLEVYWRVGAVLFYFFSLFVFEFYLFSKNFLYLLVFFLVLLILSLFIFKRKGKKLEKYFIYPIILVMSFFVILLKSGNKNLKIFQNIDSIYQLVGGERILYYGGYLFSLFLVYCFSCCLFFILLEKKD